MSMLLDALKKAALEKKGRESAQTTSEDKPADMAQGINMPEGDKGAELAEPPPSDKALEKPLAIPDETPLESNTVSAQHELPEEKDEGAFLVQSSEAPLELVEPDASPLPLDEREVAGADNAIELPAPDVDLESFDESGYCLSGDELHGEGSMLAENTCEANNDEPVDMSAELDFSEIDEIAAAESEEERLAAEWEAQMLSASSASDDATGENSSANAAKEEPLVDDTPSSESAAPQTAVPAMSADDLMAEIVADALAQTEGVAADVNPEEENENKQALANLIENGRRQREKIKRRQIFGVVLLFFITVVLAGGYYYFIQMEDSSLVNVNQYAAYPNENESDDLNAGLDDRYSDSDVEQNTIIENAEVSRSTLNTTSAETVASQVAKQDKKADAASGGGSSPPSTLTEKPTTKAIPVTVAKKVPVKPEMPPVKERDDESNVMMRMTLSQKIQAGYQAYKLQNFSGAKQFYSSALRDAPENRDALLGLAATATRMGRLDIALGHYQVLLTMNPQDALAKSGVLSLASLSGDLPRLESEVKILLSDHPSDAHLHFLLGSLYSSTGNWNGARESFYRAVDLDKFNPDYVYNLAVSMDHAASYREALSYYKQAKAISLVASPTFSLESLNARINVLEIKLQQSTKR